MDAEVFCHGHAGQWVFVISHLFEVDGRVSGMSEIHCCGALQGRLSLSRQVASAASLVQFLRAKSVEWVERTERDATDAAQIEMKVRETTQVVRRTFALCAANDIYGAGTH